MAVVNKSGGRGDDIFFRCQSITGMSEGKKCVANKLVAEKVQTSRVSRGVANTGEYLVL